MKPISFKDILYYLDNGCYVYRNKISNLCYLVHETDTSKKLRYVKFDQYLKLIDLRKKQNFLMKQEYYSFELIF